MLYNHRVWFEGEESPIGVNSFETMKALIQEYNKSDTVLYIEDMILKPFIDSYIEAMKTGVVAGFTSMSGSYYIEEGQWKKGVYNIGEIDVRRELQSYYKKYPEAMEEDKSYIEERIQVVG
jgi:hypothetical protein